MKICLISSAGGHLSQMLQLEKLWKKYDCFYVTEKREISKDLTKKFKTYFIKDPGRNLFRFCLSLFQTFSIFLKERPDIIITTGAGIAVPMGYIGRLFGKKIIFIESLSRVKNPSITGKFLYPMSNLFLVQWKFLLEKYGKRAKYGGRVF